MNKLVEKYVYDVVRRLPAEIREDVKEELKANISEMIVDETNDEEVKKILYSMGSPKKLAGSYMKGKKSIISAEWISDYKHVLKLVLIILGSIAFIFGLIEALQEYDATTPLGIFAEVLSSVISNVINSLLSGFAIVTLIFILIDNYGDKSDDWKIENLPEPPKEINLRISRTSSITGLVFTIIFGSLWIYILYNSNIYFAWYSDANGWNLIASLFNLDYTRVFVPIFLISIVLDIVVYIFKIKYATWNKKLAIIYVFAKVISVIVVVIFLSGSNLISDQFISKIASEIDFTQNVISNFIKIMKFSIIGLVKFANIDDFLSIYFYRFKYIE